MNKQRFKILILGRGYPTAEYPLNGVFEFDQAKALGQMGHDVVFGALDLRSPRKKRPWCRESFEREGVKVEVLNLPAGNFGKAYTQFFRNQGVKYLRRDIIKKYGHPDLVHVHFIKPAHAAVKGFKDRNYPLICTEHFSGLNQEVLDPYMKALGDATYGNVDVLIAVSEYLAKNLENHFGYKSLVIPNIVDTDCFSYSEDSEGEERRKNESFQFVSVGSLQKHKEMELLIGAFHKVFSQTPHVVLKIFGGGPQEKQLKKLVEEYGLREQVHLMGQRSREELAKTMKESHAFVLASKKETFGVAFIEAIVSGLPVISLAKGGPEDFIDEKNGILIPGGNEEDLCRALAGMVRDIEQYDREKMAKEIRGRFGPQRIAGALTEVYQREIAAKNTGDGKNG